MSTEILAKYVLIKRNGTCFGGLTTPASRRISIYQGIGFTHYIFSISANWRIKERV